MGPFSTLWILFGFTHPVSFRTCVVTVHLALDHCLHHDLLSSHCILGTIQQENSMYNLLLSSVMHLTNSTDALTFFMWEICSKNDFNYFYNSIRWHQWAEPDFTKCDMFLDQHLCWPWNNIVINQSDLNNKFIIFVKCRLSISVCCLYISVIHLSFPLILGITRG